MQPRNDKADAWPTKQFFVSMLTRDITLADAILDLIDNCLDGALRSSGDGQVDYTKYHVVIHMDGDRFSIKDNCGGIPRQVAVNYAFKMGRDADDDRDSDAETIGMYGIGMKRAIFKMGRNSLVTSRHGDDTYKVPITPDWLDAKGWDPLPMEDIADADRPAQPGTKIEVLDLYEGVARHFRNESFEDDVRKAIAEHFTMFIQSGLNIELNGVAVKPVFVQVLVSTRADGPAPYVFQKTIDDVIVSITVGLNTSQPTDDDDTSLDGDRSIATAGWTVLCNDRAVIVGDKSRLTGWGDGIPLYHRQFSIVTGIIEFRSHRAEKLPVTTTKRALDTSSNVWLESLIKMKEGMRVWTSYTNQWKNHPRADQTVYWTDATPMALSDAIKTVAERAGAKKSGDSIEFNPSKAKVLPEPPGRKPSTRRVVFSRPIEEIKRLSLFLFDTDDQKPGVVGETCFEQVLARAGSKNMDGR